VRRSVTVGCILILTVARAVEKDPYWVKLIMESGAEISCGGYRYRDNIDVAPKEEDELISKSIDVLQELTSDELMPKGACDVAFANRKLIMHGS
jgi:peptidoglycan/xylan/chitin deacetylase (PgdA/CDA1 family)